MWPFAGASVVGFVDRRRNPIAGWAYDPSKREPVIVDCYVDGRNVGSAIADRYRADLTTECPGGCCAFELPLPEEFLDDKPRTIELRARGASKPLTNGRFTAQFMSPDYLVSTVRRLLRSGLWALHGSIQNSAVEFGGWYISPPGSLDGHIRINGRMVESLKLGLPAPGEYDWYSPVPADTTLRKFHGSMPLDAAWQQLHLSFGLEQSFRPLHDWYYPLFKVAMPDVERRMRVHGNDSEFAFNLEGYSTATKLDVIAQRFSGRSLAGLEPVLDWGCGCGRAGRFLARSGVPLFGVDIDADNILWCSQNLPGTFSTISPNGPTSFDNNFFGSICGISVFTHLNQHYEELWLAELHRIAKPGALLFLSVLGGVAAARGGLLEEMGSALAEGFVDVGQNSGINSVTNGGEYYRNVLHQPSYIARTWGKHFDILAIEEGIIGNHQDLVVARKPLTPPPGT